MEESVKTPYGKNTFYAILGFAVVAALFALASFLAVRYESEMHALALRGGTSGMAAYVLITIVAIVVAPISTLPLMPLATSIWGWFLTGVLSIIGWTIGAQIAFMLARHFGKPLVQKLVSDGKVRELEGWVPEHNLFWTVVLLRMAIPVDILSYALGLFSRMKSVPYFLSTLIGVTPFAFVFSYLGKLPLGLQVAAVLGILALVTLGKKAYTRNR